MPIVHSELHPSLYKDSHLELDAQCVSTIRDALVSGYRLAQQVSHSERDKGVHAVVTSSSFIDCVQKFKTLLQKNRAHLKARVSSYEQSSALMEAMCGKLASFRKDLETLRPELNALNGEVSTMQARIVLEQKEVCQIKQRTSCTQICIAYRWSLLSNEFYVRTRLQWQGLLWMSRTPKRKSTRH